LLARRPAIGEALVTVGPAATLADAADSFAEAQEAFTTAAAFGVSGVVELTDLGPLPLALAAERSAARLEQQRLARLDELDRGGTRELEHTMLELLSRDQDVRATAAALHVHPNTVRYRISRFTELTGLDIRRTDDLITTWWLLRRRSAAALRR
jgi:DNA-binding PucR family transcriptional regulator